MDNQPTTSTSAHVIDVTKRLQQDKTKRLASALRDNLRRRKAAAVAQQEEHESSDA